MRLAKVPKEVVERIVWECVSIGCLNLPVMVQFRQLIKLSEEG